MAFGETFPILRKDSTDTEWTTSKAFLIVFMGIINIFMSFGNILSLVTICYNTRLRQQVSYWFVMNLAVIDLLVSLTVVPLNIVWEYYGTWPFSKAGCEFFTFADIAFSTISAYSIVLVSIDKYFYITYSIQYFDKMTRKLAVILIIAVWIFVFIFTTVSLLTEVGTREDFKDHFLASTNNTSTCIFVMTDNYVIPSAVISFFLPFGILCFTSSRIVCIASQHIRKIHTISNSLTSETDSETIKMSKARARGNTLTSVTVDSSKSRVNHQIPEINIIPPKSDTNQNGLNSCINNNNNNDDNINPDPTKSANSDTFKTEGNNSQEKHNNGCAGKDNPIFMTNGSANASAPRAVDDLQVITSTTFTSQEFSTADKVRKPRSKSLGERKSDSLRSAALKKTESIRSVSVKRKRSPYCKLFGTVTIVIACFILMFAPYNIAIVVDVWCHCIDPWVYEDVLAVLYYMHSLVNPYIYMATDRKYKAGLKLIWKKVKSFTICCQRNKL